MAARTVEVPVANLRRALDAGEKLIDVVTALTDLADHASDPEEARALRQQISRILDSAETIAKVTHSITPVAA